MVSSDRRGLNGVQVWDQKDFAAVQEQKADGGK